MIELDVNDGVYTLDMWICFDATGPAGADEEGDRIDGEEEVAAPDRRA